jgi:hypothetical protein
VIAFSFHNVLQYKQKQQPPHKHKDPIRQHNSTNTMLAHLAHTSLRATSYIAPRVAPVAIKAFSARFGARFMSSHYAVDAPDGEHDLQDIVSFCNEWCME